jgi:hypothetical protein
VERNRNYTEFIETFIETYKGALNCGILPPYLSHPRAQKCGNFTMIFVLAGCDRTFERTIINTPAKECGRIRRGYGLEELGVTTAIDLAIAVQANVIGRGSLA